MGMDVLTLDLVILFVLLLILALREFRKQPSQTPQDVLA